MSSHLALEAKRVTELLPQAPFDFDATMHKPDHFPSADNKWEPGIRWQTMLWQSVPLGLKFENQGTADRPGYFPATARLRTWNLINSSL